MKVIVKYDDGHIETLEGETVALSVMNDGKRQASATINFDDSLEPEDHIPDAFYALACLINVMFKFCRIPEQEQVQRGMELIRYATKLESEAPKDVLGTKWRNN